MDINPRGIIIYELEISLKIKFELVLVKTAFANPALTRLYMLLDLLNHEKSLNLSEGDGGGAGNPAETDKDKEKDKGNEGKGNLKTKLDCLKLKKD